jgi:hypothetical protein
MVLSKSGSRSHINPRATLALWKMNAREREEGNWGRVLVAATQKVGLNASPQLELCRNNLCPRREKEMFEIGCVEKTVGSMRGLTFVFRFISFQACVPKKQTN